MKTPAIRNTSRCWWRRRKSAGRCTGNRRARKLSSATRRRATPSARPSWRSTTTASSSPCACAICATRAPMSRTPASTSTPTISRAACPACTASRRWTCRVACYFTNTAPIAPYRGAGRPEANYALERVVEEAARVIGIDPVRLRKKNLIPPSAMPFKTAVGTTYDSGDFPGIVEQALELSDYANFNKRKRDSARRKKLPRHRHLLHARACRRHADGTGLGRVPRRRQADPRLQRAVDRPEPRHRVWPPAGGQARHRRGYDRAPARRFRAGAVRLCLGRLALGDVRRQRHRAYRRRDAGEGQEDRLRRCWRPPKPTSSTATAASKWSAPTARFRCSRPRGAPRSWAKASTPRTRPTRR